MTIMHRFRVDMIEGKFIIYSLQLQLAIIGQTSTSVVHTVSRITAGDFELNSSNGLERVAFQQTYCIQIYTHIVINMTSTLINSEHNTSTL